MSRQTISTITDKVIEGMAEWQNRPLDPVYPVVFIDAINVKIRDGQVANRPIYVALAVTVEGHRDILGLWAGDGGEGAKYWLHVLTELKNRGVADVLMVVCDGLTGLPDAIGDGLAAGRSPRPAWCTCCATRSATPAGSTGTRSPRRSSRSTPRATEAAAKERFARVRRGLGRAVSGDRQVVGERLGRVRAVPGLRRRDPQGHLLDQRDRERERPHPRAPCEARGHFPNEQAALKCVYLAVMSLDPTGTGRTTLDHALETRPERLRDRLRGPPHRRPQLTLINPSYTVRLTDPADMTFKAYDFSAMLSILKGDR